MFEIDPKLPRSPAGVLRVEMNPARIFLVNDGIMPGVTLRMQLSPSSMLTQMVSAALKTTLFTMPFTLGQK